MTVGFAKQAHSLPANLPICPPWVRNGPTGGFFLDAPGARFDVSSEKRR